MLDIIFVVITLFIAGLVLYVASKRKIKAQSCHFGYHVFLKGKYYCLHCGEGRGTLKVINGSRRDASDFKF